MLRTTIARHTLIVLGLLLAGATSASAAGINCAKARTHSEHAICNSTTLVKLDQELAVAYRNAAASNPADRETRSYQREWPAMRDARCIKDELCLVGEYEDRIRELNLLADINAAADGS